MKKVIALLSIAVCFAATSAIAQPPGGGQQMDPAQRIAMMKERLKPAGLTDVQADSVVAIYMDRSMMAGFRDMTPEERQSKMKELSESRQKRMEKAGLSADQAKKVVEIMSQRPGGGGGGGGRQ